MIHHPASSGDQSAMRGYRARTVLQIVPCMSDRTFVECGEIEILTLFDSIHDSDYLSDKNSKADTAIVFLRRADRCIRSP